MKKISGFTLIEFLVVLVIIGIMVTTVVLSNYKTSKNQPEQFNVKFINSLQNLVDESILKQKQYGLIFYKKGIVLLNHTNDDWTVNGLKSKSKSKEDANKNEDDKKNKEDSSKNKNEDDKKSKEDVNKSKTEGAKKNNKLKVNPSLLINFPKDYKVEFYLNGDTVSLENDLKFEDSTVKILPHIIIASSYEVTPFELQVSNKDNSYVFKVNSLGEIDYAKK